MEDKDEKRSKNYRVRPKDKGLNLDRVVFFSDAVVAIAITLLALDLKFDEPIKEPITWASLATLLPKFAAFLLSFILIALFWIIHNQFFRYIKRVSEWLTWINIIWLLFIVLLPFSASLLSSHFGEPVATVIYALNTLGITAAQNFIWDYVAVRPEYLEADLPELYINRYRLYCNIGMINALIAVAFAPFAPVVAFIILFTRPQMMTIYVRFKLRHHSAR